MTALAYHPPRTPADNALRTMCQATLDSRSDIRRMWWLSVEYLDTEPRVVRDEIHIELIELPGRFGASREFFRDFSWEQMPVGRHFTSTYTPQPFIARVRAFAELVADSERGG